MTAHQHREAVDSEPDDELRLLMRRTLLRRAALGLVGLGVVSPLTACRGDEESEKDADENVEDGVQTVESEGDEVEEGRDQEGY